MIKKIFGTRLMKQFLGDEMNLKIGGGGGQITYTTFLPRSYSGT